MNLVALEEKLAHLKSTVEGDLKDVVLKVEAVFQHVRASHVEDLVKDAVYSELHDAAIKIGNIAATAVTDSVKQAVTKK